MFECEDVSFPFVDEGFSECACFVSGSMADGMDACEWGKLCVSE